MAHLSLDIIAISQSTKFLLTSCIPYIELNRSSVGMEHKAMDLNTQGSYILLLKFTRWRFTNVVFPVPPSPTNTSLNWTWGSPWAAIVMLVLEASPRLSDWGLERWQKPVWYHLYVESKKYNKLVNITKKKQTHRYREQTGGYQMGDGRWGRGNIGVGD